jgi:hypothetical protein
VKKNIRILSLGVLALFMLLAFSCTTDNKPTTPNFEDFSPYVWDYDSVIWFDLDYDVKLGAASVDLWLSAKGEGVAASLKINNQPVAFQYEDHFTGGKIYSGASIEINTTQPVTYEITRNGKKSTGNMELPDMVTGNFPAYAAANNFAPSWTIVGDISPSFQVINSYAEGENGDSRAYTKQIAGDERNFSLLSTFWQDVVPIDYFSFDINAITYKMKNNNKVLTVGVSNDDYLWSMTKNSLQRHPRMKVSQCMDLIHKDMQK